MSHGHLHGNSSVQSNSNPWSDKQHGERPFSLPSFVLRETLSVSTHLLIMSLCQLAVAQILEIHKSSLAATTECSYVASVAGLVFDRRQMLSYLDPALLRCLCQVSTFSLQIGLTFALGKRTGSIPNIACRVCEYRMKRLSLVRLFVAVCIHLWVGLALPYYLLQDKELPWARLAQDASPKLLSETDDIVPSLWILITETLVLSCFVVEILVLPVLILINRISKLWVLPLLYPLFYFSVDYRKGMDVSVLNPLYLYDQVLVAFQRTPSFALWYILPQVLGGALAGYVMIQYFPDETLEARKW
jgi:hypothetical protein